MSELLAWSADRLASVDGWLETLFGDTWPPPFAEVCRYPLFGGGKRIRPLLVIAAHEALGGHVETALPAAAAVELIHTYSLVHDDLPCMDDDDERRGRPTVHVAFDEAQAVLAGDALLTEAFGVLAVAPWSAELRIQLVAELALASGHRGMVGGQAADVTLGATIRDPGTLERLHRLKTGALIRASVRMGAMLANADPTQLASFTRYGEAVGLAFQLADDVLDADEADDDDGPPNYVRLLGVEATRAKAKALSAEAHTIAQAAGSPILAALASLIADRDV